MIRFSLRRLPINLDDPLWAALHARSRQVGVTVSELICMILRDRFPTSIEDQKRAMIASIGLQTDNAGVRDPEAFARRLRENIPQQRPRG